jgi:hypothetical protein
MVGGCVSWIFAPCPQRRRRLRGAAAGYCSERPVPPVLVGMVTGGSRRRVIVRAWSRAVTQLWRSRCTSGPTGRRNTDGWCTCGVKASGWSNALRLTADLDIPARCCPDRRRARLGLRLASRLRPLCRSSVVLTRARRRDRAHQTGGGWPSGIRALAYACSFAFFASTVVYALAAGSKNWAAVTHVFGGWLTVHCAIMVAGGIAFGAAVIKTAALPRWTAVCLMAGSCWWRPRRECPPRFVPGPLPCRRPPSSAWASRCCGTRWRTRTLRAARAR